MFIQIAVLYTRFCYTKEYFGLRCITHYDGLFITTVYFLQKMYSMYILYSIPFFRALLSLCFKTLLLYFNCRIKKPGILLGSKQSYAESEWQEEGTSGGICYYYRGRSLGNKYFPGNMVWKYYRTATNSTLNPNCL